MFENDNEKKRKRGKSINGPILNSAHLSMVLRWIAGGDKFDIASNHGVGVNEVMTSVCEVVSLENRSENLKMKFPSNYSEQEKIADGFASKSNPSFKTCVGCIDGMLILTDKPSEKDKCGSDVGSAKFFCGRKIWNGSSSYL